MKVDHHYLEGCRWFIGLREEDRQRCLRLLAAAPGTLHLFNRVEIRIVPRGGCDGRDLAPQVTMTQLVPLEGGSELLGWTLKRMCEDLLAAKTKAYEEVEAR